MNRHVALLFTVCGMAIASVAGAAPKGRSSGADVDPGELMCISPDVPDAVLECPSGSKQNAAKITGRRPKSRMRQAKRKKTKKNSGLTGPSITLDEAAQRNRAKGRNRAWGLLQKEERVLQRMVRNTRKEDNRRPKILLRLAETYFEMQSILKVKIRSFDEPLYQAEDSKNQAKVKKLKSDRNKVQQELRRVRQKTIETYVTLATDHRDFSRMDEVLFSLAYGLEELNQYDKSQQAYYQLIREYPSSRYVPFAYLSFGEKYFRDGDMKKAQRFYDKVTEYSPARNPVYGYALYKSAWAHYNVEDFQGSLQKFVEVIEFSDKNPQANDAKNLARQSRKEMVVPYARVGTPRRALQFFRRFNKSNDDALLSLESLAELYADSGQWTKAVYVFRQLLQQMPRSERVCVWQTAITNAIISSRPKKVDQLVEVRNQVDLAKKLDKSRSKKLKEASVQCNQKTATVLLELATAWHREAVGTDSQPGTRDRETMNRAGQLYRILLTQFPNMDRMRFPDIDKRDWPTKYRITYYMAELMWKAEDWKRCGPAFDAVVKMNPKGEFTSDAAYAAVLCYNNLYKEQYGSREKTAIADKNEKTIKRRKFSKLETGMLGAFERYLCYVSNAKELPKIKYRRARIYYEANHFDEAAVLFKDIAFNHKNSELAIFAANLYLDSLNVMASMLEPRRPQCIFEMKDAIQPLWAAYCESAGGPANRGELCGVLEQLRCDVMRKAAEEYQRKKRWRDAAKTYVGLYRRFSSCGKLDEVLYNAAINYDAAHLVGRAIRVRQVLVDAHKDSSLRSKSLFMLGANYHAIAVYSKAAEYYEKFARQYPRADGDKCSHKEREEGLCPIAHQALENAVLFRLGLGDTEKALENGEYYEKAYRRRRPLDAAKVNFALGRIYERQRAWNDVVKHYASFLKTYRRSASPHLLIKAHVAIGQAFRRTKGRKYETQAFESAVKEWNRGAERKIKRIRSITKEDRDAWVFSAKDGASEALFYLAERDFEKFSGIRFPKYRGGKSLRSVNDWAKKDFKNWIRRKQKALVTAEKAYSKIADLKIPRWEIAAASRIGLMWSSFVDEFRDAPVPKEIEAVPELYDAYVGSLDEKSEPFLKSAIDKFEFCLITATRVRWFSDFSRTCELELNRLNPAKYPLGAELRSEPEFVYSPVVEPGPVRRLFKDEENEQVPAKGGGK